MAFQVTYVEDSFKALETYGTNKVDCIITDPPYSASVQSNLCSGSLVGKKSVPKRTLKFDPLTGAQHIWLIDACAMSRRWVVSFCAVEDFGRFQDLMGPQYVRSAIYARPNSMGQLTRDRPATAYEGIALLHNNKTKKRWNGRGSYGIWSCNSTRGKKDRHPNEKPINLCLKLVALFSDRGETVFDPFCGSAAIGEACLRLGRNYIGWDFDPEWVEKSSQRLANVREEHFVTDEYALSLCKLWGK